MSADTETPTESEVEPESAIDQIDIDLNPKPQTSSVWGRFHFVRKSCRPSSIYIL